MMCPSHSQQRAGDTLIECQPHYVLSIQAAQTKETYVHENMMVRDELETTSMGLQERLCI
jgi:hypothetical protein